MPVPRCWWWLVVAWRRCRRRQPAAPPRGVRPELLALEARDVPARLGLLVPAYFDPSSDAPAWGQLAAAARQVPVMAIMNPDDGPGSHRQADYVAALAQLRAAGGEVLGYVHTSYGKRSLDQVRTEIKEYRRWYHVDGIFVDEMTSNTTKAHLRYYRQVDAFVHHVLPGAVVVGNPGLNVPEAYAALADELVLFEDGAGYDSYAPPPWQASLPASRFANIAYNVPSAAAMQGDVILAVSRRTGWIYVTDDTLPNPYDRLPAYWAELVGAVAAENAGPAG